MCKSGFGSLMLGNIFGSGWHLDGISGKGGWLRFLGNEHQALGPSNAKRLGRWERSQ